MTSNPYLMILVVGLSTMLTRSVPFLFFGRKKQLPSMVNYLSIVLPASIMVILVCFGIRNSFSDKLRGLPELISLALIMLVQVKSRKTFLSVFVGTACYMVLIRIL